MQRPEKETARRNQAEPGSSWPETGLAHDAGRAVLIFLGVGNYQQIYSGALFASLARCCLPNKQTPSPPQAARSLSLLLLSRLLSSSCSVTKAEQQSSCLCWTTNESAGLNVTLNYLNSLKLQITLLRLLLPYDTTGNQ